jgi:fructokinase
MSNVSPYPRVMVVGEILCDLFPHDPPATLIDTPYLVPHLGGAPTNVAVQLARLGETPLLLSVVGQDPMGMRVLQHLAREGVDLRFVRRSPTRKTGLTFIQVDSDGERQFFPWRKSAADEEFCEDDLSPDAFQDIHLLHHGTVGLRGPKSRVATQRAVQMARASGALISLDVNLRFGVFEDPAELKTLAIHALAQAHVLKATSEEAQFLFGEGDNQELLERILSAGPKLVMLTHGAAGATIATRQAVVQVDSPQVNVVDATGAGDAFTGVFLTCLIQNQVSPHTVAQISVGQMKEWGRTACSGGAYAVTKVGATSGMTRSIGS